MSTFKEERFTEMLLQAQNERREIHLILGKNVGCYGLVSKVSDGLVTIETTIGDTLRIHHVSISDILQITYEMPIKKLG